MDIRGIVGFLLLSAAGVMMGLRAKRAVGRRVRSLYALAAACEQMENAIAYAKTPPSVLVQSLAAQKNAASDFFDAVSCAIRQGSAPWDAWQAACAGSGDALCLLPAELAELRAVGSSLTALNSEAAQRSIASSAALFSKWAGAAEAAQKNEERLKLTLWLTSALLLGILLL